MYVRLSRGARDLGDSRANNGICSPMLYVNTSGHDAWIYIVPHTRYANACICSCSSLAAGDRALDIAVSNQCVRQSTFSRGSKKQFDVVSELAGNSSG